MYKYYILTVPYIIHLISFDRELEEQFIGGWHIWDCVGLFLGGHANVQPQYSYPVLQLCCATLYSFGGYVTSYCPSRQNIGIACVPGLSITQDSEW